MIDRSAKTKQCRDCGQVKSWADFGRRNPNSGRGLKNHCLMCADMRRTRVPKFPIESRARSQAKWVARLLENRAAMLDYLDEHPCVDCGETDPVVLTFDHRPDETKSRNVSTMMDNYVWSTILTEINKCDVRCFHCHHRKTAREKNYWYYAPEYAERVAGMAGI